jgi:hypothetical protein
VVLWINDEEIARGWRVQPPESVPGRPLELRAGDIVTMEMWYFQSGGDWTVRLDWESDRFPRQTIPAAACSPPLRASRPKPSNNAVNVGHTPQLSWSVGQNVAQHDVYLGTDADAVAAADTSAADIYQGRQDDTSFAPATLEWNTTYYWRIDEVNDLEPDSPWKGPVWNFTTANFHIVDDMEGYNDLNPDEPESNRIFLAWIDGFDNPAVNGSIVGYASPPFAEQTIVHSGLQSMPFEYDNAVGKSEATLTLTSNRDWTVKGVDTLAIWYIGDAANAAEQMYVVLNGSAVVTNDNPDAALATSWTELNINLQAFADQGVNLANVTSITLGLGNRANPVAGGSGMMYFDDIRLYPPAP